MQSFLKKYQNQIIIITTILLVVLISTRFTNMFGSNTDWINQHTIIPEYFRSLFYQTGKLIPEFALNYGAGENIYNLSYYGLLSPIILPSYLLPFISMTTYMTIVDILIVISSALLFNHFLKSHKFDNHISLVVSLLLALSAPLIFQMHRHIMFVNYMPFLIMSLIGVDKLLHNNKKSLLIISIFLMIMTSYYYSVCGLLVIGIYYLMEYFTINIHPKTKVFIIDLLKFLSYALIGIMLSAILLLPTIYTLLLGRGTSESTYTLLSLLTPYLKIHKIFCGTYAIGLSLIAFVALIYLLSTKKKNYIIGASCTSLVLFIPIFRYLLNGGLYLREKCFIPFLPLLAYFIAIFLKDLYHKKIQILDFTILVAIISALLYYYNRLEYCYLILLGFLIILLIYQKYPKKILISSYLIASSLAICIGENLSEDYVSIQKYNQIFNQDTNTTIKNILATDNTFYRMNNLDNPTTTVNKIYDSKYYTTNFYSSTYNKYYLDFVRNEFSNSILDYNYFLYSSTKNPILNSYMGIKYLYSTTDPGLGYTNISNNLYRNNTAFPIIYTTTKSTSTKTYNTYSYPYNQEILLNNVIIDNANDDEVTTNIEEYPLEYTLTASNDITIEKNDSGYILNATSNNASITLKLKSPLKNKLLFIELTGLKENTCSIDNITMTINNVTNVLTCKTWIYSNKNNTFHYLINDNYLDTLNITLTKGTYNIDTIKTYILDYSTIQNTLNNKKSLDNITITSSMITGSVNLDTSSYLVTTIPYDEGFTIYLDDKPIDKILVNKAFIGANIPSGNHTIKITYHTPWLNIGKIISLIGLLLYIIIIITDNKERSLMKKIKELYLKYKEIINYLIFGVLTTVVSLGTYYALVLTILDANNPVELQIANIISWIVCVTFAYITNKKYVFTPTNKSIIKEMIEFYTARLASLFIDMGLMFLLVSTLHFNDKIVKIIIQVIIIIVNYILSKLIVFKKDK